MYAGAEHLFNKEDTLHDSNLRVAYNNAQFLRMAMLVLEPLGEPYLYSIEISAELRESDVKAYSNYLHNQVYPDPGHDNVKAITGDVYEKVMKQIGRCYVPPTKRAGKPRKDRTTPVPYGNGWFMVTNPADGRILAVEQQFEPENNAVATGTFTKAVVKHP